jgi:hypothetical protein
VICLAMGGEVLPVGKDPECLDDGRLVSLDVAGAGEDLFRLERLLRFVISSQAIINLCRPPSLSARLFVTWRLAR